MINPNPEKFGPDYVANKNSQKRQTKQKEKCENHVKIPISQVIEPGIIVDKLVDCEVDAIVFVESQKKLHSQSLCKARKNAIFCMGVKSKRKNNFLKNRKRQRTNRRSYALLT